MDRVFRLPDLLYSGQFHSWSQEGRRFDLISQNHYLAFSLLDGEEALVLPPMTGEEGDYWEDFFALDLDLAPMVHALDHDPVFKEAYREVPYIRILRQDPYEVLITYILSANNNMKRIRSSLARLRRQYGEPIQDREGTFYKLPGPEVLARLSPEELRKNCGTGYRDKALVLLGKALEAGDFSIQEAKALSDRDLYRDLNRLYGVGDKVAQCVMLFGFHRLSAFPVDVWMERVMKSSYPVQGLSRQEMASFARKLFGPYAGYAQQVLFEKIRKDQGKLI